MGQADGGRPAGIEVLDRMIQQRLEIIEIAKSLQWAQSAVGKTGKTSSIRTSSSVFLPLLSFKSPL